MVAGPLRCGVGSGLALAGLGEVVDAGAELGHPVTVLLPTVGLPPAVLLELAAVVLHPLIRPGPQLVGVAGALLGDLGPAPHISSLGRRRGRGAGGRLGPVGGLLGLREGVRGAPVGLLPGGVGPPGPVPSSLRVPFRAGVGGPGPVGLLLRLRPRRTRRLLRGRGGNRRGPVLLRLPPRCSGIGFP